MPVLSGPYPEAVAQTSCGSAPPPHAHTPPRERPLLLGPENMVAQPLQFALDGVEDKSMRGVRQCRIDLREGKQQAIAAAVQPYPETLGLEPRPIPPDDLGCGRRHRTELVEGYLAACAVAREASHAREGRKALPPAGRAVC